MYKRALELPKQPNYSFFLWGPRKVGKSTLLKQTYPDARWIQLLKSDEFRRYQQRPELLRQEYESAPVPHIVIDEIQKVPQLLDEVHYLIEEHNVHFCLCGSSARKLKRGHANLLGGRALRYQLNGLTHYELKRDFDLLQILNKGYLPSHYLSDHSTELISSYVADYLKEEIFAESLTQNLQAFSNFLEVAALSDGQQINFTNIARESGVSAKTVKSYFQILEDTLMGSWVPAYIKNPKRRLSKSSKFYFFDVGVVNHLARRGRIEYKSELIGYALENWVHHELKSYIDYHKKNISLQYWRTSSGDEVDFILNGASTAIEVKATSRISKHHLKSLRSFKRDHPEITNHAVVCLEPKSYVTDDNIQVLNFRDLQSFLLQIKSPV